MGAGRLRHLGEEMRGWTPTEPSLCTALRDVRPFGRRGEQRLPEQVSQALRSSLREGGKFGHALPCCCRWVSQGYVRCAELPQSQRTVCRRCEFVSDWEPCRLA